MIDIQEIMKHLPHRYPMLLVDRVVEFEPGVRLVALKNVTINEHFFVGHYPDMPVMPGVLILECMAQAGAVMLIALDEHRGKVPLLGSIGEVKFRRPVTPGDQLKSVIELDWMRGTVGKFKCHSTVDDELVASADMVFKLVDRNS